MSNSFITGGCLRVCVCVCVCVRVIGWFLSVSQCSTAEWRASTRVHVDKHVESIQGIVHIQRERKRERGRYSPLGQPLNSWECRGGVQWEKVKADTESDANKQTHTEKSSWRERERERERARERVIVSIYNSNFVAYAGQRNNLDINSSLCQL